MVIIGYSGHAYVACGILAAAGKKVTAYCDFEAKATNPYQLEYLGPETSESAISKITNEGYFIAVGDNQVRKKVYQLLSSKDLFPVNAIHPSAIIDPTVTIVGTGIMISAGACINPLVVIGNGVICNTACIVEHECILEDFVHIGPGTVICGNVFIGAGSFIGAAAVIRQGVRIGKNVTVGAGAVVLKDIPDNEIVIGNPSRILNKTNC